MIIWIKTTLVLLPRTKIGIGSAYTKGPVEQNICLNLGVVSDFDLFVTREEKQPDTDEESLEKYVWSIQLTGG